MDWDPPMIWDRMAAFLKGIAATLPERPRALLLVSAHWLEPSCQVTGGAQPPLIYDYQGFPPHTYQLQYPAPGNPALAQRVAGLLEAAGIPAHMALERGFDHGVFIPLLLMFPAADIPVVQLSLLNSLDPGAHLAMGKALAPLRDEGVLIIGSGMSFHNMRAYGDARFGPVSEQFDAWLTATVESVPNLREVALTHWAQAPAARLSHPPRAEEHLLPLMVAVGAAGDAAGQRVYADQVMTAALSGFRFG